MSRGAQPHKRAQWLDRLRRFASSNLSVAEFCRREQVSVPSYYHWRRKLADVACDGGGRRGPARAAFLPVQVEHSVGLQASFPNGARLTLPVHDRDSLQTLVEAVASSRTARGEA